MSTPRILNLFISMDDFVLLTVTTLNSGSKGTEGVMTGEVKFLVGWKDMSPVTVDIPGVTLYLD